MTEDVIYSVVFKAVVDKSGRITIPLAERETSGIKPYCIVQVKLRVVGELPRGKSDNNKA